MNNDEVARFIKVFEDVYGYMYDHDDRFDNPLYDSAYAAAAAFDQCDHFTFTAGVLRAYCKASEDFILSDRAAAAFMIALAAETHVAIININDIIGEINVVDLIIACRHEVEFHITQDGAYMMCRDVDAEIIKEKCLALA